MFFSIVLFFSSCVSNTAPKENWDQPPYTGKQRKEKRSFSDSIVDSAIKSAFDSTFKSSRDKEIDSDTKRMLNNNPLKHHSSYKHLRASRDQRRFDEWDQEQQ